MTDVAVHQSRFEFLPEEGERWKRWISHRLPLRIDTHDRVYLIHDGALWGYGEVIRKVEINGHSTMLLLTPPKRVTLPCTIRPFVGFRYRWWDRVAEQEKPHASDDRPAY